MRDHFDCHCGMEVVLANGELVRTGMGALPNSKTWQQYKYGFGPYVDGIFSQSNLGVVTKMGFWLYPEPEAFLSGNVVVGKHDDLFALVEIFANLIEFRNRASDHHRDKSAGVHGPIRNWRRFAPAVRRKILRTMPRGRTYRLLERIASILRPAEVVAAQWEYAKRKFCRDPRSALRGRRVVSLSAGRRSIGENREPRSFRRAQPADIFDWRPAQPGTHVVFADYSDDRGSRSRGAASFRSSCTKIWASTAAACGGFPVWNFFARAFVIIYFFPIEHDVEKNRRNREIFRRLDQNRRRNTAGASTARTRLSWATSWTRIRSIITRCCACMRR